MYSTKTHVFVAQAILLVHISHSDKRAENLHGIVGHCFRLFTHSIAGRFLPDNPLQLGPCAPVPDKILKTLPRTPYSYSVDF